jgi:alkyl sulfatase BDS1-like metallo-beta-lactamase superfamily hydrolase
MAEKKKTPEAIQLVTTSEKDFTIVHPRKDVYCARVPLAGCAWIDTDEGVVVIDTLLHPWAAEKTLEKIHESGGKVEYIIYTHHHLDHINGCEVFMSDRPRAVIANHYLPSNLDKYKMLAQHRARIAAQQFNIPEIPNSGKTWVYPTQTFLEEMSFSLGGKTFELHAARGETDDVCWVWVPEIKTAFLGDLIIRSFPNIGNPWKPTRFALDWAKTLEQVRALQPELIIAGGANIDYHGEEALRALDDNIAAIRSLHDQVVACMNRGIHISEMIHQIQLPDELKDSPYLRFGYSRPEFFVYNTYRWYHGYFDGNPANLLPRPEKEVKNVISGLIGDPDKILGKVRSLLENGQAQLGLQVLDILVQADPNNIEARKTRIELLEKLVEDDYCVMSRNTYVYFIEKDKEFIEALSK